MFDFKPTVGRMCKKISQEEADSQKPLSRPGSKEGSASSVIDTNADAARVATRVPDDSYLQLTQAPKGGTAAKGKATQRLGELIGFLLGCCGSLPKAFRQLDINQDNTLDLFEWEHGLSKLGFADDVSYVWRLLGKENAESVTLDEIEALFEPILGRPRAQMAAAHG